MKKLLTILFAIASLFAVAQTPSAAGFNYQSVIRTTGGTIMASTAVTIEFKLYSTVSTFSNVLLYHESHSATTNQFGMANVVMGKGIVLGGSFSFTNVPWPAGVAYEVFVNSNQVGTRMPFVSVPYAFAAAYAPAPSVTFSNNILSVGGNTVSITAGSTYTAGSDISITSGTVINNTSPDKIVTITSAGAATVTSAYPNFTVDVPAGTTLPTGKNGQFLYNNGTLWDTLPRANLYFNGTNFGVGTAFPAANFHVNGDGKFNASVTTNQIYTTNFKMTGTNAGYVLTSDGLGNGTWQAPVVASQSLSISSNSLTISGAGGNTIPLPASPWLQGSGLIHLTNSTDKVGIGTTSPVTTLDVMGNARLNDGKLFLGSVNGIDDGYTGLYRDNDDLKFAVFKPSSPTTPFSPSGKALDAMIIKSQTGYVGIGTTSPNAVLDVTNTNTTSIGLAVSISNGANPNKAVDVIQNGTGTGGSFSINNNSSVSTALYASTTGGGVAVMGQQGGTGGRAAEFVTFNNNNTSHTLFSQTAGLGAAGFFEVTNTSSTANAVSAHHYGPGATIVANNYAGGGAGAFSIVSTTNTSIALSAQTNGTGHAMLSQAATGSALTAANSSSTSATILANNTLSGDVVLANASRGRAYYGSNNSITGLATMELASNGDGSVIFAYKNGGAPAGNVASFSNNSLSNSSDVVLIADNGMGNALYAGKISGTTSGNVAKFENLSTSNGADAVFVTNKGSGATIHTDNGSTSIGSNLGLAIENGHIGTASTSNLTAVITNTILGSITVDGHSTDVAGTLRAVFTGTPAVDVDFNVTFAKPYKKMPVVTVTPSSVPNAGSNYPKYIVSPIGVVGNYSGFKLTIVTGSINSATAAPYLFNYMVIEGKN